MEAFESIYNFFTSPMFRFVLRLVQLFVATLWLASVIWVYRDAKRRGGMALTWATVALLFPFIGLIVFLILRPSEYLADVEARELDTRFREAVLAKESFHCPACHRPVDEDYLICPSCLKKLKKRCRECERLLRLEWVVCPYCKADQ